MRLHLAFLLTEMINDKEIGYNHDRNTETIYGKEDHEIEFTHLPDRRAMMGIMHVVVFRKDFRERQDGDYTRSNPCGDDHEDGSET